MSCSKLHLVFTRIAVMYVRTSEQLTGISLSHSLPPPLCLSTELKSAHALCYIAIQGLSTYSSDTNIVVSSFAGPYSHQCTVAISYGTNIYCVPTVCPQGSSVPATVYYQEQTSTKTCYNQGVVSSVYPGDPKCYGSKSACEGDATPNVAFNTACYT